MYCGLRRQPPARAKVGSGEAVPDRPGDGFGARSEGELGKDVADVGSRRVVSVGERRSDLPIGASGCHQAQHRDLPWGQSAGSLRSVILSISVELLTASALAMAWSSDSAAPIAIAEAMAASSNAVRMAAMAGSITV